MMKMGAFLSITMGAKEYVVLAVFFLGCGGFVSGIVWLARRYHPLSEFRSYAAIYRSITFKRLGFAIIGTNVYHRSLDYGIWDDCLVFREAWIFGIFADYYAVPLSLIRRIPESNEAVIQCDSGEVRVQMERAFMKDLAHSGL